MEKEIDIRKTQEKLKEKIKSGSKGIFDGEPIFKMPFNNLFTIGETGSERILLPTNEDDFKVVMEHITLDGKPVEIVYKDKVVVKKNTIEYGTCPVCNGEKRVKMDESQKKYAGFLHSSDKETMTINCGNCGGQYQWGNPSGKVRLNKKGKPCKHNYDAKTVGNCLTESTCRHCGDVYRIDSGD